MRAIFNLVYHVFRFCAWMQGWGQRRFTPAGLCVVGGMLVAGMMGPDTDNNVAYQAFTVLLCLLSVAVLFSLWFRAQFAATRLLPRFATAGAPFSYVVAVRNLSSKTQRGLRLVEMLAEQRPAFDDWLVAQLAEERRVRSFRFSHRPRSAFFRPAVLKESEVPVMAPQQQVEVRAEVLPVRRGMLRFSGVALGRPDPLGLFLSFIRVPAPQTVLVLPKRYALPSLPVPGTMKYQPGGVALAANVGQSEEFVALRDYRQGDPLRHIHWRSWARAGKPVVKEFEDEFFVRHALVLDTFTDHPHSEAFEEAVSVAASFAWSLQTQESLLDLLFVGPDSYCFTTGRGLGYADQMLEVLASVRVCTQGNFEALEGLVLAHLSAVSGCVCVLLAWDESRREFIRKLRSLDLPVRVLVVVEPGEATDLEPGPLRDEPDKFHVLEAGRIEQGLANLR